MKQLSFLFLICMILFSCEKKKQNNNALYDETQQNESPAQQEQASTTDSTGLNIGDIAPQIALPDPSGKVIPLSSLRGKYVLVDFWASWCGPCRGENPNNVRLYQKYAGPKFEIYGVSLDSRKDAWTQAIQQDNLTWTQVSDLGFWRSSVVPLYNIEAIPATVLLDPSGKIIARDLRGEGLAAKLKEIFGS